MKFKRNIKNLSESEIIELAKKESYYFGILYDVYFEQIFRFVFSRLGGNESIAGDVTQETFLKAMANIQKYEDRGFPFSSWLYRIAQNEVSMYFRKSKKDNFVPVEIEKLNGLKDEITGDAGISEVEIDHLISMINELEASHLDIIELRFFQQMSFKEISEIYNISEANAKMRTYRILEKLKSNWGTK